MILNSGIIDRSSRSQGGILPFVAFVILMMTAYLAFVLDVSFLTSTKEQAQYNAHFVALAAIEEYFDHTNCSEDDGESQPCSPKQRYDAALERARTVFAENFLLGSDKTEEEKVQIFSPDDSHADAAILEPGMWYGTEPAEGDPNPCVDGEETPCFKPITLETSYSELNSHPNAFRIKGYLYNSDIIQIGGGIFGSSSRKQIYAEAVASLVPRHGCFLVDISNSMVRETHKIWNYRFGDFFNWYYDRSKPFSPANDNVKVDGLEAFGNEFAFDLSSCDFTSYAGISSDPHCVQYYWLTQMRATRAPSATVREFQHYASDYISKISLSDNDYNSYSRKELHPNPHSDSRYSAGTANERYMFDTFFLDPDADADSPGYHGPQPLTSVFEGLKAAMTQFGLRRVAGDEVCLIFYDQSLQWPRIVNLTSKFDKVVEYTNIHSEGGALLEDGDGQSAGTSAKGGEPEGAELIIRHKLYPGPSSSTNMLMALEEAYRQLRTRRTQSRLPSSDFIVLIGDGLANCRTCPSGGPGDGSCEPGCSNDLEYHKSAMEEVKWLVREEKDKFNVPVHVVQLGTDVKPHTRFVYGAEGKCMSDEEAMAAGILPVKGGGYIDGTYVSDPDDSQLSQMYTNMSSDSPYMEVNKDMAEVAMISGGKWLPIRPPPAGGGACNNKKAPGNCGPADTILDTDPDCRETDEQIVDFIDVVLKDNPYSIVNVR